MTVLFVIFVAVGGGLMVAYTVYDYRRYVAEHFGLAYQTKKQTEKVEELRKYLNAQEYLYSNLRVSETRRANAEIYAEVARKKLEVEKTKLEGMVAKLEQQKFEERMELH